jgi:hypothetical protein
MESLLKFDPEKITFIEFDLSLHLKVKVRFTLEETAKTQRGSRGITLAFL